MLIESLSKLMCRRRNIHKEMSCSTCFEMAAFEELLMAGYRVIHNLVRAKDSSTTFLFCLSLHISSWRPGLDNLITLTGRFWMQSSIMRWVSLATANGIEIFHCGVTRLHRGLQQFHDKITVNPLQQQTFALLSLGTKGLCKWLVLWGKTCFISLLLDLPLGHLHCTKKGTRIRGQ